ncbi:MAG: DUF190 domain-containing protein [Anaerolineae bacterium]
MEPGRAAQRLTIYFGEADRWQGKPLHTALLDALREAGMAGATLTRGLAGFGAHGRIHAARLADISADLPMVVVVIDTPERIAVVLETVTSMVGEGLITLEDVTVIATNAQRERLAAGRRVSDVMSHDVASVRPDTPLHDVTRLLVDRDVKAAPVVDGDRRVVGIITGGDLLTRGGLPVRLSLQKDLPSDLAAHHLRVLEEGGKTAADIMTAQPATIQAAAPLNDAARLMAQRHVKRLPVVDADGRLVGIVSRLDVLRAAGKTAREAAPMLPPPSGVNLRVRDIMAADVPTAHPDTPLDELLPRLVDSPLRRVVIVDSAGHVVGLIADAMLLNRALPHEKPRAWSTVRHWLGLGGSADPRLATVAREVMAREVYAVRADASILDAIEMMVDRRVKRLVVVDEDRRLMGMVDRQRTLQALAGEG